MKKIPYGESNFEKIIREGFIYVDKTIYLEEMEKTSKLIYLRPRRFGKSLLTSMLDYYYGLDRVSQFDELFEELHVHEHPTPYKNKYYILKFDFSGTSQSESVGFEDTFNKKVFDGVRTFIERYDLEIDLYDTDTPASTLSSLLIGFGALKLPNKIYIIIDEYDHFTNGLLRGDAKEFLNLLQRGGLVRGFYEIIKEYAGLGTVDRFFATGIMPVSLDTMTSGFNISTDITTDPRFVALTGFDKEEVENIIESAMPSEANKSELYEELRQNYNGYRFSENNEKLIFNSTLVMYYLSRYLSTGFPPKSLVDRNLNTSGVSIRNIVELINPKSNYKVIEEIVLNNQVHGELVPYFELDKKYNRDDLLTLLFHMGFLTIKDAGYDIDFTIPNYVMETVYAEYLAVLLEQETKNEIDTEKIKNAIRSFALEGDIKPTAELVKEFLTFTASRDARNFNEKNLKHTFSMFLSLSRQYIVYGEYPAGQGFVDIFIQKSTGSMAKYEGLIELKYLSKANAKEADIQQLKEEGKAQMQRYLQDKRLQERENLKKFVIVFLGFEAYSLEEIA